MRQEILPIIDVKKYGGQQVAILDGSIVATGETLQEVVAKVRRQVPSRPLREVKIFAVPTTLSVIYGARIPIRHHPSGRRKDCTLSCR